MSFVSGLRCLSCSNEIPVEPFRYQCPTCGGYLEVQFNYEKMKRVIDRDRLENRIGTIMEQWIDFLPIEYPDLIHQVTLGELPTPMFRARSFQRDGIDSDVWFKNEAQLPTGSLKDRSMPLMVLKALEQQRSAVGIVSSGNASASLAAYAAAAGLKAVIFIGKNVPQSKLYKTMIYQPVGIQVMGVYSEAEKIFQQARNDFDFFDCNGLVNPYRVEGKKTFSYEVARDLRWKAPEAVFIPTAYGNGIVAAWKGFKELYDFGFIDRLPAIVAVQPENCSPIAQAFDKGLDHVPPVKSKPTLAEAVAITDPMIGGQRVLETVRASNGLVVSVSEAEIAAAMRQLGQKEGLAMEGAGALGAAAWLKLAGSGHTLSQGTIVISLTGIGLNDMENGSGLVENPVRVDQNYRTTSRYLEAQLQ